MAKVFEIYVFYVFNDSFRLLVCLQFVIIVVFCGRIFDWTFQSQNADINLYSSRIVYLDRHHQNVQTNQFKAKVTKIMPMPIFGVPLRPFVLPTVINSFQENAYCRNRTWTSNLNMIACIQKYLFRSRKIHRQKKNTPKLNTPVQLKFIENCLLINIQIQNNNNLTWMHVGFLVRWKNVSTEQWTMNSRYLDCCVAMNFNLSIVKHKSICFVASKI